MNQVTGQNNTLDGGEGGNNRLYDYDGGDDTFIVRAGSYDFLYDKGGNDTYLISPEAKRVQIGDSGGTLKIGDTVVSGQATPVYSNGSDNIWYYTLDGFVTNGFRLAKTLEDLQLATYYGNYEVFSVNVSEGFGIIF